MRRFDAREGDRAKSAAIYRKAHEETDADIVELAAEIEKIYGKKTPSILKDWFKYMAALATALAPIYLAINTAHKAGNKEEEAKQRAKLQREIRKRTILDAEYQKIITKLARGVNGINSDVVKKINKRVLKVYENNYTAAFEGLKAEVGVMWHLVNPKTIELLEQDKMALLPSISMTDTTAQTARAVNAEVLQGIAKGEDIPTIAERIHKVTGGSEKAAIRNARTAITCAENEGRLEAMREAEAAGVVLKKIWMAFLDSKTRDSHIALNGQEKYPDEPFESPLGKIMCPADPDAEGGGADIYNCRCTMITRVVGFNYERMGKER